MTDALQYFGHELGNAKINIRLIKMLEQEKYKRVCENYMEYNSSMYLVAYMKGKE